MKTLEKMLEYADPLGWEHYIYMDVFPDGGERCYVELKKDTPAAGQPKLEIGFDKANPVPTFLDGLDRYYQNFDLEDYAAMSEQCGFRKILEEGLAIDHMLKDLYQTLSSAAEKILKE